MSYELVETIDLASTATAVAFSSIPQDGTDLFIIALIRSNSQNSMQIWLNGDQTTYRTRNSHETSLSGSSIVSWVTNNTAPANVYSLFKINIPSYTATNINKAYSSDAGGGLTSSSVLLPRPRGLGIHYNEPAAITSITIYGGSYASNDFRAGSSFSLYKLKA